jgi:CheY-like chemotaxis protein
MDSAAPSVLLVDDEALVAKLYGRAIASIGFTPRYAGDGEEALDAVEQDAPALIITDLNMPGIGGFALTEKLNQRQRKTMPVILASADDSNTLIVNGLESGVDDFLVKGMGFATVIERVRFWVDGPYRALPRLIRDEALDSFARTTPVSPPIARLRASPKTLIARARATLADLLLYTPHNFGSTEIDAIRMLGVADGILERLCHANALAQLRRPDVLLSVLRGVLLPMPYAVLLTQLRRFEVLREDATFLHARQTLGLAVGSTAT